MPRGSSLSFGGLYTDSRTNGQMYHPLRKLKLLLHVVFHGVLRKPEKCTCCEPAGSNVDFPGISSHTGVSSMFPISCKL